MDHALKGFHQGLAVLVVTDLLYKISSASRPVLLYLTKAKGTSKLPSGATKTRISGANQNYLFLTNSKRSFSNIGCG
jgi:hypothetical protein